MLTNFDFKIFCFTDILVSFYVSKNVVLLKLRLTNTRMEILQIDFSEGTGAGTNC